jgi:hypothetical protein
MLKILNQYKKIYLIFGLVFFIGGIVVEVLNKNTHDVWMIALSHFLLIFGEALVVFFLINVVLEHETKQRFLDETKSVITEQERKILTSFDETASALVKRANNMFNDLNSDIFRVILQERTSKEIAKEINQDDFFKSNFLKMKTNMHYKFSVDPTFADKVFLSHEDVFIVKNIAKEQSAYLMTLSLTSSLTKKYSFETAGYTYETNGQHYTDLSITDFTDEPIPNLKTGKFYKLNNGLSIKPEEELKVYRSIKADFVDNNVDGIEDFFFTTQYMLPFTLTVSIPPGYEFNLYPTFPSNKLVGPYPSRGNILYDIPFLFPGQGFSFALSKKQ